MTRCTLTSALALVLMLAARPATADLTGFLGVNQSPDSRAVRGGALGSGLLVVGFEFEYAATNEDPMTRSPSLKTGMGNILLQTPVPILRMQPYVTTGAGIYRERLGSLRDTGIGYNTGGGVKITLAGPLRVRLDYRLFRLGEGAVASPSHRLYAGLNLKF